MRLHELTKKEQSKLILVKLIEFYMNSEPEGGTLHTLLSDGNYSDANIDFEWIEQHQDVAAGVIGKLLLMLDEEEREQLCERSWELYEKYPEFL